MIRTLLAAATALPLLAIVLLGNFAVSGHVPLPSLTPTWPPGFAGYGGYLTQGSNNDVIGQTIGSAPAEFASKVR